MQDIRSGSSANSQYRLLETLIGLCTAILIFVALYFARSIFVPVTFSLFIIAIVWPLQGSLQAKIPRFFALAITIALTVALMSVLGSLIIWSFGIVGHWLFASAARFQTLYTQTTHWLEGHGIFVTDAIMEYFDVNWLIRAFKTFTGQIHGLLSFAVVTLMFLLLGLLEVDTARRKLEGLGNKELGQGLVQATKTIAAKFRKFIMVRTFMCVMTGIVIWGFASIAGLEFASAWGIIAFTLNYIPFIGPFIATVLLTLFAIAHSESWELALIAFLFLNFIQFMTGYLEPRIAGATLSVSPFVDLFAVFFWMLLWGIPGAFIGVPIIVAVLTICGQFTSTRWIADLLSGQEKARA